MLYRELELKYIFKSQSHTSYKCITFFFPCKRDTNWMVFVSNNIEKRWFFNAQAEDINFGQKNLRYVRYWQHTSSNSN